MRADPVISDRVTRERRSPTAAELTKRIGSVTWLVGFAIYVALCMAAVWLARRLHMDPVNIETLTSIIWLPMGAVAIWVKNRIEDYMLRPIDSPATDQAE